MAKKNKEGRPTKLTEKLALNIYMLSRKGLTEAEIADVCFVSEATIKNWKKLPEFLAPIKENKEFADAIVRRSLFERACGYDHKEEKVFMYEGEIVSHETVRHYPPDTTACIFWLKNRQPALWRDVQNHEHDGEITVKNSLISMITRTAIENRMQAPAPN